MSEANPCIPVIGHPEKPLVYSSVAITERRRRILREARHMIAEVGIEGFSVRELSRRAAVAQRTLYNAFLNKDRIIMLAIRETFEEIYQRFEYTTSRDTIEGIIDRLISVNQRNFRARNYTKAITFLYFSPSTSTEIVDILQEMALVSLRQWLNKVEAAGDLIPWVCREEFEISLVSAEYSAINDWARERISSADYLRRLVEAVLIPVVGATRNGTHDRVVEILEEIRSTGSIPVFQKPTLRAVPA